MPLHPLHPTAHSLPRTALAWHHTHACMRACMRETYASSQPLGVGWRGRVACVRMQARMRAHTQAWRCVRCARAACNEHGVQAAVRARARACGPSATLPPPPSVAPPRPKPMHARKQSHGPGRRRRRSPVLLLLLLPHQQLLLLLHSRPGGSCRRGRSCSCSCRRWPGAGDDGAEVGHNVLGLHPLRHQLRQVLQDHGVHLQACEGS